MSSENPEESGYSLGLDMLTIWASQKNHLRPIYIGNLSMQPQPKCKSSTHSLTPSLHNIIVRLHRVFHIDTRIKIHIVQVIIVE